MKWFYLLALLPIMACDTIRALIVERYPTDYQPKGDHESIPTKTSAESGTAWPPGFPKMDGDDANRQQVKIDLAPVLTGLKQPTDFVFFPGSNTRGFALEKTGQLIAFDLEASTLNTVIKLDVLTRSEQGLLGVALHPKFNENGRFFLHASVQRNDKEVGEVTSWIANPDRLSAQKEGLIISVIQPYANHNAGQMAFGPDGMLYIGFGDGGWRNDPHNHGQNGRTILGSLIRINTDDPDPGKGYSIPPDNPWVNDDNVIDEAWAIGLRNPWKFCFTPDGKMVLADVGQNAFEEINIVGKGDNLGWNVREATHCFPPESTCRKDDLVDPFFEYPHPMGSSVTGGFVHTSDAIPEIQGDYVFADFVSGRIWATPLPQPGDSEPTQVKALGQWPFLPSTFSHDNDGRLYVADFGKGTLYKIEPG